MKKIIKKISVALVLIIAFSSISVNSLAETVLLGDVNGDGKVGLADVQELKKYIVGKNKESDIVFANSDVNKSGCIEILDMLYLRKYLSNEIEDFNSIVVSSNLLAKVNNAKVTPEDLGIPGLLRYPNNSNYYYARNIWDMKSKDGKLFISMGDYGSNTGSVPMYYYTNDSSTPKLSNHLGPTGKGVDGLSSEEIKRMFLIDGELYAVSTDPLGMNQGSYYKYDNSTDTWIDYYNLPYTIHCYDMVEYDGKIFFGGMARHQSTDKWLVACVQVLDKDKLGTSAKASNVYFYHSDGTKFTSESYVSDYDGKTYYRYDYWRAYDMFVFKNELYAVHSDGSSYTRNSNSGLFKYDKDLNGFVQVYDGKVIKGIMSVTRHTSTTTYVKDSTSGSYVETDAYFDFENNNLEIGAFTIGIEPIYSEFLCGAKISTDDTFVAVCNGIFKSSNVEATSNAFEEVSLGEGYENYVTRDAFEKDGKYYFLASVMNGTQDFTTAVFETDGNFETFRKVLSFDTPSFARSFECNGTYLYVGLGGNGRIDNLGDSTGSKYSGTVYRIDLNEYI